MIANWQIYAFEDALETAVNGWLSKNGINDPTKQRDSKILNVPYVETKSVFGGSAKRHYYTDGVSIWADFAGGTLYLKVVTSREPGDVTHSILRGQCRSLMVNHKRDISALMPLHEIEGEVVEQTTATNIDADRKYDVSNMSFAFTLRIRSTAFPVITP